MEEEQQKLTLNHRYVVFCYNCLSEFQVIEISEKYYKIKWLSSKNKNDEWISKGSINFEYVIKEDLGLYTVNEKEFINDIIKIGEEFLNLLLKDSTKKK